MEVSLHMFRCWYWVIDHHFLSIALEEARPHILVQNVLSDTAVRN